MKTTLNHRHQSARSQVALDKFQWHMNSLRPDLAAFATSTYTILQFLDHIQESGIFKEYTDIYSNHNIDQYNTFLSSFVKDTEIIPWNSNVLLSDLYHSQCRLHRRISYDKQWSCDNPLHTGYVMVEEYANMILNDVCNCYLGLDSRQIYC
ncbi:hypothetical protein Pcinc_022668 [Petrolisthes cinctipes]|uniref:Uncharacterized protein n=1 Tax=Petrolisthes cinctipes TaxID=88211 RepID=A0AAE1KDC9_PETCI|nr:hypothetical protein Pcinc_022668 [Petrolisthes cinctipes]